MQKKYTIKYSSVWYLNVLIFTVTGFFTFYCLELGGPCTRGPWTLPILSIPLLRHCLHFRQAVLFKINAVGWKEADIRTWKLASEIRRFFTSLEECRLVSLPARWTLRRYSAKSITVYTKTTDLSPASQTWVKRHHSDKMNLCTHRRTKCNALYYISNHVTSNIGIRVDFFAYTSRSGLSDLARTWRCRIGTFCSWSLTPGHSSGDNPPPPLLDVFTPQSAECRTCPLSNVQFSGLWGSFLGYPVQNMEVIWVRNFWGEGGKVKLLIPIAPKWEVRDLEFFVQLGPLSTEKWNISIRTPCKGG